MKVYVCKICGKEFLRRKEIRRHIMEEHRDTVKQSAGIIPWKKYISKFYEIKEKKEEKRSTAQKEEGKGFIQKILGWLKGGK